MVAMLNKRSSRRSNSLRSRAVMEALEGRELFSGTLLGIGAQLNIPVTSVLGNPGSLTYSAATHNFDAVGAPMSIILSTSPYNAPQVMPPSSFDLHIKVDSSGNLQGSGAGTNDLVVTGSIDMNNDGTADYSGVLLTGKVTAFGWEDSADVNGDKFDFRFSVTGGALAPTFFTGKDIGVAMSVEDSTFTGSFCQDSSALVKGNVGAIPQAAQPPATIYGKKFQDMTGNGMSADDKALAGWTIKLYADANGNGKVDSGEALVDSKVTAADGSYAFTGLAAGKYVVAEATKSGWIQTGPVTGSYGVTVAAGDNKGSFDFDNFQQDDCKQHIKCIYYVINGCKTVNDLRGNVHQGDTVKVVFTLDDTETFSLVSYTAPEGTFVAEHASQQKIFDYDTKTYGAGTHSLCVTVPDCYFQIDFVCGFPIDKLGPAGSNIFYTPQDRLISADNGGTKSCDCGSTSVGTGSIAGTVFEDCNNNGKKENGETGLKGVKITLTGTTTSGEAVSMTTTTDANGNYKFSNLKAGKYKVSEADPDGFFDGKDMAGTAGGSAGNDVISNINLNNGQNATNYNFGELKGAAISGIVFNDGDKDGKQDRNESGIRNVKITLSGIDDQGNAVSLVTYTDASGKYSFDNLRAGKYSLTETQPDGYMSTKNMAGSNGGSVSSDKISNICLDWCDTACNYNFGEKSCTTTPVCPPPPVCTPPSCNSTPDCDKVSMSELISKLLCLLSSLFKC
jgi:hypothetical protein